MAEKRMNTAVICCPVLSMHAGFPRCVPRHGRTLATCRTRQAVANMSRHALLRQCSEDADNSHGEIAQTFFEIIAMDHVSFFANYSQFVIRY